MEYNKGDFITTIQNKLCDGVADIKGKTFTLLYVRDDPLIHQGRAGREGNYQPKGFPPNKSPEIKKKRIKRETL